jgi:transcriptional regulator with AAA-type ATPase domain
MRDDALASETTTNVARPSAAREAARLAPALAIIWSRGEPARVGEIVQSIGADEGAFGRAPGAYHGRPLELVRQRPGEVVPCGSPCAPGVSRMHLLVRRNGRELELENVGRRALRHGGREVERATAAIGDVVEIDDELAFLVVARPGRLPCAPLPPALTPAFGGADEFGIVGESPASWELRRQLAFAATRDDHVLLTGPSGSGKELAARAIHRLSSRRGAPLVARNAATFPEALVDAELFGNMRDYPNPGMVERPGLLGAADESTLFLDEIGELPHALQAHLLRVLDGGEYQRLGEARARRSSARLVTATNRDAGELKHDLLARLRLRVAVPGLDARREDVPLIARHLLRAIAAGDPEIAARFFHAGDPAGEPHWTARFVTALVTTHFTAHVRELAATLWHAMLHADGDALDALPEAAGHDPRRPASAATIDPRSLDAAQVRAALDACAGVQERTWRALGLRSRYQLIRVMRKLGISPGAPGSDDQVGEP